MLILRTLFWNIVDEETKGVGDCFEETFVNPLCRNCGGLTDCKQMDMVTPRSQLKKQLDKVRFNSGLVQEIPSDPFDNVNNLATYTKQRGLRPIIVSKTVKNVLKSVTLVSFLSDKVRKGFISLVQNLSF